MIYFDNSATSYPKPYIVRQKVLEALQLYSFNIGRSGYKSSLKASEKIYSVREKIASMFNCYPQNVIFTKNCTEALNLAIKSLAPKHGHIIISSLEHNSVARVVKELSEKPGIEYSVVPFDFDVNKTISNINKAIRKDTSLAVFTAASNAFGVTLPINKIGRLCSEKGIKLIVDAAQAAGVFSFDMEKDNIDVLCAPGHKSLMGPMGTGFAVFKNGECALPLLEGGTGSNSLSLSQPKDIPEGLEAGTLNNVGIIGLGSGIDFINNYGIENIYNHEMELITYVFDKLSLNDNVVLYTPKPKPYKNVPVLSFNLKECSSEETALKLSKYDICTRAGFHCAPLAHRHFNTLETGTVRISLSLFNTYKECYRFLNVIKKL